jgi:hypothetical protein
MMSGATITIPLLRPSETKIPTPLSPPSVCRSVSLNPTDLSSQHDQASAIKPRIEQAMVRRVAICNRRRSPSAIRPKIKRALNDSQCHSPQCVISSVSILQISDYPPNLPFKGKDRRVFLFEQSCIIADCIQPKKEFGNPTYYFKNQIMVSAICSYMYVCTCVFVGE